MAGDGIFNLSIRLNASRSNGSSDLCWTPSGCHESTSLPALINTSLLNLDEVVVHEKPEKVYWALLLIILPISAVFGNILVILSVYKEKCLQSVTNYFIVSLAFADLFVAGVVMPFAVYFLVNVDWELSETLCDFWIAFDVTLSTASILNLVAISIDRFMAVTRPIKYAKHKSNNRVKLTIAIVWIISIMIGSPIVLGLNTSPDRTPEHKVCIFYNSDFIIYSSLGSFYIPCLLMVLLYYRIFKAIRARARKTIGSGKGSSAAITSAAASRRKADDASSVDVSHALVIENVAQTKHQEDTSIQVVDKSSRHPLPLILEAATASQSKDPRDEEEDDDSEDSSEEGIECKVIRNPVAVTSSFHDNHTKMRSQAGSAVSQDDDRVGDERREVRGSSIEYPAKIERGTNESQGNPDSGYAPSSQNLEGETQFILSISPSSDHPVANEPFNRNTRGRFGRKAGCEDGDDLDDEENDKDLRATGRGNRMNEKSQAAGNIVRVQQSSSSHPEHHPHHLPSSQDKKKTRKESVRGDSSGSKDDEEDSPSFDEGDDRILPPSTSASPAPTAATPGVSSVSATVVLEEEKKRKRLRFHLRRKKSKETTKKMEKASAKRERKATKTLAIVLGVFLICWVPFFTCNIIDAICIKLEKADCRLSTTAFLLTTWLGYLNSTVNPVIYTIFNPEFRKSFKKILGLH